MKIEREIFIRASPYVRSIHTYLIYLYIQCITLFDLNEQPNYPLSFPIVNTRRRLSFSPPHTDTIHIRLCAHIHLCSLAHSLSLAVRSLPNAFCVFLSSHRALVVRSCSLLSMLFVLVCILIHSIEKKKTHTEFASVLLSFTVSLHYIVCSL